MYDNATYRVAAGPDAATIRARGVPGGVALPNGGAGIKIGVIDDGVDQTHPFFDPTGFTMPAGFPKGQTEFTTAKVIVARAFAPPRATWRYASTPFDPDQSGHGTHVAGIAAGDANVQAEGQRISGIAPRAQIGNYKALTIPTDGDVGLDGNAPEIVAAIEAAVADGMDVINLSIGEPEIEPSRDLVALALDAAAAAGVVPVVAAGNDYGDFGAGSLASPGTSVEAITVGATTSGSSPSMAGFSAAGPTPLSLRLKPDVVAPGDSILSSSARRLAHLVGDEHGSTPRLGRRRAPARAAPRLDAGPGEGVAHRDGACRRCGRLDRLPRPDRRRPRGRRGGRHAVGARHADGGVVRARRSRAVRRPPDERSRTRAAAQAPGR